MNNTLIGFLILASSLANAGTFKEKHSDTLHESNFRVKGVTHMDGGSLSYGICQIKLETAKAMARLNKHLHLLANHTNLDNPRGNALFAALYLRHQLDLYNNNWRLAADAYNKGNAVSTNSRYVNHVMQGMEFLQERLK